MCKWPMPFYNFSGAYMSLIDAHLQMAEAILCLADAYLQMISAIMRLADGHQRMIGCSYVFGRCLSANGWCDYAFGRCMFVNGWCDSVFDRSVSDKFRGLGETARGFWFASSCNTRRLPVWPCSGWKVHWIQSTRPLMAATFIWRNAHKDELYRLLLSGRVLCSLVVAKLSQC